jgi:uncharacterized membrane protein
MDTKKFLIGTLVGGVAFFFLGYLMYGVALSSFFAAHAGASNGDMKTMEQIVWWALILGNVASGALLTYIFLKLGNISTFGSGASTAAAIGFFMALSMDLIRFATSNSLDLTASLADVAVETFMGAIAGGIIGVVLGMGNKS